MVEGYHIQGKKHVKISGPPFELMDGDVYVFVAPPKYFVWLGDKSSADEKAVGAWVAKTMDEVRDMDIDTEVQGEESDIFRQKIDFKVVKGDTPGFLKHVEIDPQYEYKMYLVQDEDPTNADMTDVEIKEVPWGKGSLDPGDVFVIDAGNDIYVWVGSKCQIGEKIAAGRYAKRLDQDRKRTPKVYHIYDGDEPKEFWNVLEK